MVYSFVVRILSPLLDFLQTFFPWLDYTNNRPLQNEITKENES